MARPSPLSRPGPRLNQRLGAPLGSGDIPYDPDESGSDADNVQDAIDDLYELIGAGGANGFPRPLMAEDAGAPGYWYVVVDGDGNAIMITA